MSRAIEVEAIQAFRHSSRLGWQSTLCRCRLSHEARARRRTLLKVVLNPLFRTMGKGDRLGGRPMSDLTCCMIKRRAEAAGLPYSTCCHTFRATGITTYLQNGGTLEHAQTIANHESPRTTKLYDRTCEELSFEEVQSIKI